MRFRAKILLAMVTVGLTAPAIAGLVLKKTPYFASISAGQARMGAGPATT